MPEAFKWKDPKSTRPGSKAPNFSSGSDTATCPRYRAEKHHRSGVFCQCDLKEQSMYQKGEHRMRMKLWQDSQH